MESLTSSSLCRNPCHCSGGAGPSGALLPRVATTTNACSIFDTPLRLRTAKAAMGGDGLWPRRRYQPAAYSSNSLGPTQGNPGGRGSVGRLEPDCVRPHLAPGVLVPASQLTSPARGQASSRGARAAARRGLYRRIRSRCVPQSCCTSSPSMGVGAGVEEIPAACSTTGSRSMPVRPVRKTSIWTWRALR